MYVHIVHWSWISFEVRSRICMSLFSTWTRWFIISRLSALLYYFWCQPASILTHIALFWCYIGGFNSGHHAWYSGGCTSTASEANAYRVSLHTYLQKWYTDGFECMGWWWKCMDNSILTCSHMSSYTQLQVFVLQKKLFTLEFIDESLKKLNLRMFDGDKSSPLSGLSLTSTDANLHQHGISMFYTCTCTIMNAHIHL